MRNICTVNCGTGSRSVLNSGASAEEIIMELIPSSTQKTNFRVEVTKSGGGVITSSAILLNAAGTIHYSIPADSWRAIGTMRVRLLSNEGNSAYISFNVQMAINEGDNIQVTGGSGSSPFNIKILSSTKYQMKYIDTGWIKATTWNDQFTHYGSNLQVQFRQIGPTVYITGSAKPTVKISADGQPVAIPVCQIPDGIDVPLMEGTPFLKQGSGSAKFTMRVDYDRNGEFDRFISIERYGRTSYEDIAAGAWLTLDCSYAIAGNGLA